MKKLLSVLLGVSLTLSINTLSFANQEPYFEEHFNTKDTIINDESDLLENKQKEALDNYFIIEAILSDDIYGGCYINDNNNLVIQLITGSEELVIEKIENTEGLVIEKIEYEYVNFTKEELDSTYEFMTDNMDLLGIQAVSIDVIHNNITVPIGEGNNRLRTNVKLEIEDKLKNNLQNEVNPNMISISKEEAVPELLIDEDESVTPQSGNDINSARAIAKVRESDLLNNGTSTASIAFGYSNRYLISSGHAFSKGDIIYVGKDRIGVVTSRKYNGTADSVLITLDGGIKYSFQTGESFVTSGTLPVGTIVRQKGAVTGNKRAKITNMNYSYNGNGYTWRNLYVTDVSSSSGDSGGSLQFDSTDYFAVYGVTHATLSNKTYSVRSTHNWH